MKDRDRTKQQLIQELIQMRGRVAELETREESERQRAERALRESEERYRALFDNYGTPITLYDVNGRLLLVNSAGAENLGGAPEDFAGKSILELHPDQADIQLERIRRIVESGEGGEFEDVVDLPSGKRWFWSNLQPVKDQSGHVFGVQIVSHDITERKKIEEMLGESEARLRSLLESSPDIVYTLDRDHRITFVNRVLPGYDAEQVIGSKITGWIPPEHEDTLRKSIDRVFLSGETVTFDVMGQGAYGSAAWYSTRLAPILQEGEVAAVLLMSRDITERKRAEEALRESEQKYRHLFENLNDAAFLAEVATGRIVGANRQAEVLLGRTRDEIIGMHQSQIHPPGKAEEYAQRFASHIKEGHAMDYDGEAITKDGSIVPVTISAATLSIAGEEFYRLLAENTTDMIWTTDLDTLKITYVSPSVTRLRGYSVEEAMAQTFEECLTPASLDIAAKAAERAMALERGEDERRFKPLTVELEMTCQDGSTIWTESVLTLPPGPDGRATQIMGIARDISDRKRAEREARAAESLREAERLRSELLANVSHELRAPLASIKGYCSSMLNYYDRLPEADKLDSLHEIDKASDRLTELVERLLELSRLEAVGLELEMEPTLIAPLIGRAVEDVKQTAGKHRLVTHVADSLPAIMADPVRIRQVLDNLLDNAVKFSPEGTEISVSCVARKGELVVSVRDEGMGMSPEDVDRVFDRFYRAATDASHTIGGAGLGLAICRRIMEAHGGRIRVESTLGEGSTFIFSLPLGGETDDGETEGKGESV